MIPSVSVVIPTYKRPGLLAKCLSAVIGQDLPPEEFEIIVVDDEPSEATRRVVELHAAAAIRGAGSDDSLVRTAGATPAVRYIAMRDAHGPAAARNAGWRAARAPVIAFTDDDCLPEAGWLSAGLTAMDAGADGVSGKLIVPIPDVPSDYEATIRRLEDSPFVTANCFYRRDALADVGGFDERFRVAWREDSDLQFRMLKAGYRLVGDGRARVLHPVRDAPWWISLKEQQKSQYNALLFRKHPEEYRRVVQGRPPLGYYSILLSLAITLRAIAAGRRRVAAAGAIAWLVQTAAFAGRRLRGTRHDRAHVAQMALTSALIPPLSVFWRLRGAVRFRTLFL